MFDDPERYEYDGFYEEDTDYEDEYETDDSDYIVDDEEDENALWDDEKEAADDLPEKKRRKRKNQVVLADNDTDTEETELSEQARELRAEALARLEDSARTQREFENVIAWWDRLDANRERRERYHELSRSGDDVPLDYGASANELFFPDTLNDVLEKQLRKGDFIDAIFYCPYDIHELVTEEYLSKILWELNEEHKELLFLCAVRLFSSTRIAKIRNQSDRNIRKVRGTMLKKIRKKLLPALLDKAEKQQPMTLLEKDFLEENMVEIDSEEKKSYNW